jgi:alpha-tubulin suppressor-like RCC1 family protein
MGVGVATVYAWGQNSSGQLGVDLGGIVASSQVGPFGPVIFDSTGSCLPTEVDTAPQFTEMDAGTAHSLGVDCRGQLWGFGSNSAGQLGLGSVTVGQAIAPTPIPGVTDVVDVSAGAQHSLVLKSDGTVLAMGDNGAGQLGVGSSNSTVAIPTLVSGLSNVVALAGGPNYSLAVDSAGVVWAWGEGSSGELGDSALTQSTVPVQVPGLGSSPVVSVAAGDQHALALDNAGVQ